MPVPQSLRLIKSLALVSTLLVGGSATAAPGDHIRVGDATITPSLRLGMQYRSNSFRTESNNQGSVNFNITPGLAASLDTQSTTFTLNATYTARSFLFLSNGEELDTATNRARRQALDRFNNFNIAAGIQALKNRQVGFGLTDALTLQNNPNDGLIDSENPYVTQLRNALRGNVDFRPGPAFLVTLAAEWTWAEFYVANSVVSREVFNTRNAYGPRLRLQWKFLPRTALVYNAEYTYNNWAVLDPSSPEVPGAMTPDSHEFRTDIGLQGQVTERLRLVAMLGYGVGAFENSRNTTGIGGLLVTLRGDYKLSDHHRFNAGYTKSFFDSFFTNAVQANALFAGWNGKYGDKVTSSLRYGIRFENYIGSVERNDVVNIASAGIGINATEWMNVGINGSWLQRRSTQDLVEFDDFRAGLGLTFQY